MLGHPASQECQNSLGVPLAAEKIKGPSTTLTFLGITMDTLKMEISLPEPKLLRIRHTVQDGLTKQRAKKREILSLFGLLQHEAKMVRGGKTFVSRMYSTTAQIKEMDYKRCLNLVFRSDLCWWHVFLESWNSLSLLRSADVPKTPVHYIQSDASDTWGCAAYFNACGFNHNGIVTVNLTISW